MKWRSARGGWVPAFALMPVYIPAHYYDGIAVPPMHVWLEWVEMRAIERIAVIYFHEYRLPQSEP